MKLKNISKLLVVVAIFICTSASAQKLTKVDDTNYSTLGVDQEAVGCWVLDCTKINPEMLSDGSITSKGDLYTHTNTDDTNYVYKKLLIAASNYGIKTWNTITAEDNITIAGYSDWRLPTQRELMLIWVVAQSDADLNSGFTNDNYWSATSYGSTAWIINMKAGSVSNEGNKSSNAYSRLVREL